jgi:glycine/D-amino acid oxidase-like deaminating enzyme
VTVSYNVPHIMPAQNVQTVIVVGSGVYGVTAAISLKQRGYAISLFDPGPLPHPLAASTDISKVVRLDYGPDADYMTLMETALERWREWNAVWPPGLRGVAGAGEPLFHETGFLLLCRSPMAPGEYEYESYQLLLQRGRRPERLDSAEIRRRYPAWNADPYVDGYFNPEGGYAESGRVVAQLVEEAQRQGVKLFAGQTFKRLHEQGSRVAGIVTNTEEIFEADWVVTALGAWTPHLLPFTRDFFRSTGMPVFHLQPANPELFRPEHFPVFNADISHTGYYGFPLNREGVVKIANHGIGREMHPESAERAVTAEETAHLREFLRGALPSLVDAPIVYTRVCLYCDSWDGHFWIARDPQREGLVIAAGDSGHGFKFAPVLGDLIADAVEGAPNPLLQKFRWRPETYSGQNEEAARHK